MKKILVILLSLSLLSLWGCSNENKTTATSKEQNDIRSISKEDFNAYFEEINPILEEIGTTATKYEDIRSQSAEGKITDQEVLDTIYNELLPEQTTIQEEIEAVMPKKEFRETHELLNQMIAKNQQAYTEILSVLQTGDTSKMTSANELLTEARKLERDFMYGLQDLADTYGVELKKAE